MAYTATDFVRDLVLFNTGAALGMQRARKLQSFAAKKGIRLVGQGALLAARGLGGATMTAAQAHPYAAGAALGGIVLASPPGQELLAAAEERGKMDRVRAQQAFDEWWYGRVTRPAEMVQQTLASPTFQQAVVTRAKRKVSKYGKAIKAGMTAVKKSKFSGKPGTITNPKQVFSTVSKVTSAVNKGKKVATKGIRGTIARAVRRIL